MSGKSMDSTKIHNIEFGKSITWKHAFSYYGFLIFSRVYFILWAVTVYDHNNSDDLNNHIVVIFFSL